MKMNNSFTEGRLPYIPLWLVWVTALSFVLIGLGSFGILDNNEGLYAEIPREMLAAHDWRMWIIPHLNGLPYMEKPPLLYWLTALSFALFGESEWSARLVPALSSLACVGLLLGFGNAARRPQAGRLAAIMFSSGVGVIAMSRVLMFDMLLTALLTAALMFAYRYQREGLKSMLRISYAFLALALLAKGLVALVLFGLVALTFTLSSQRSVASLWPAIGKWFEPTSLFVFMVIAAPWHIAASLVEPVFAWFYFINEHVLRFLGRREPHDYYAGAWWYYLPRMALYLFPWTFLLTCLIFRSKDAGRGPDDRDHGTLNRYLWLAWLLPLAFFSVSSAKANYYLVAVMPFAAFHLALAIEGRNLTGVMRALPGLIIGAAAAAFLVALVLRNDESKQIFSIFGLSQREFVLGAVAGIAVLALAAARLAWRRAGIGLLAYLAVPVWTAAALGLVLSAMDPLVSTRQLAHFLSTEHAQRSVYLYRNFEEQSSLPFYLKKPVPVIEPRSNDLFWGGRLRVNDIMLPLDKFALRLPGEPLAVVVMDRQLKDFKASGFFEKFKSEKRMGETTVFFN
ncbi:N/A [soil metagenome]